MNVCTFFGHSECYGLDAAVLRNAIENLIEQGTNEFLVGNNGQFDGSGIEDSLSPGLL